MPRVPAGYYTGVLCMDDFQLAKSTNKETAYVTCSCIITEKDSPYKGQRIGWQGFLTSDAQDRTIEQLLLGGHEFVDDDIALPGTMFGKNEVTLVIEDNSFTPEPTEDEPNPQERITSRVSWINRLGVFVAKPLDLAEQTNLSNSLKGLVKSIKRDGRKRKGSPPSLSETSTTETKKAVPFK